MFWIIFGIIVVHGLVHLWLEFLNLRWLGQHRGLIPEVFNGRLDPAEVARAEDYTTAHIRLGFFSFVVSKGVVLAVLLLDGFAWISRLVEGAGFGPVPTGLLFFGVLILGGKIISLPFDWYETFRLEQRFDFNRTTYRLWIGDMVKGLVVGAILGGGLLLAVLMLLYHAGSLWWLICWAFVFGFTLVVTEVYPVLIAPLFNKFVPLEEGTLRERVTALMREVGIRMRGVFVMDAGKRSRHSNAYFTGLGGNKRIVLFDTLIEKHSEDEILAVLAHEAGHWKKKHVLKGLLLGQAVTLLLFAATGWLVGWEPLYRTFGFDAVVPYAGLLLASLVYGPATFLLGPLSSWLSRCYEYQADRFARRLGLAEPLAESLMQLARHNLSNLKPHPVYVFFHYSHPPVVRRVEALRG